LNDFSYVMQRGERLGIIGPNGAGKTTLLDMIAGRIQPDSGTIELGPTVVLGYFDQESRELKDDVRLIDYVREAGDNVKTADGTTISAGQMAERFLFPPAMQFAPIAKLSGGERKRLYLLRLLMSNPNVLLLDEPTNDLDIPTLVALEGYLDSFGGCVIVVSHDRYFLDRVVDHLFRFEGDGSYREYPVNYSAFLEIRQAEIKETEAAKPRPAPPTIARPEAPKARKLSYKEKQELARLEQEIESAEARKKQIEHLLSEPADYEQTRSLYEEIEALTKKLESDIERWSELAEQQ
jgi:ATP-binding cassette subfamily F protein uup